MNVVINAVREGYSIDQIYNTMTAGELVDVFSEFDPDTPVYLGHDLQRSGFYTFGGITYDRILSDDSDEFPEGTE